MPIDEHHRTRNLTLRRLSALQCFPSAAQQVELVYEPIPIDGGPLVRRSLTVG